MLKLPDSVGLSTNTVDPGYASPTSVAMSRSGVSIDGLRSTTTTLRSTPFSLASVTTSARPAFSVVAAALTPSSLTSAITRSMQVSTDVVAASFPTGPHTSGGI